MKKIISLFTIVLITLFMISTGVRAETNESLGVLKVGEEEIEVKELNLNVDLDFVEVRAIDLENKERIYTLYLGQYISLDASNSRALINSPDHVNKEFNSLDFWSSVDGMGLEYRLIFNDINNHQENEMYSLNRGEILKIERVGSANLLYYDLLDGSGLIAKELTGNNKEGRMKENVFYPNKEGHMFMGWYLDEQLTKPLNYPFTITGDMILYPKFQELSADTIEINFINFSQETPNYKTLVIDKGISFDLDYFKPYKKDKLFVKYYLDEDLTQEYETGHVFNENTTVYADYENEYFRVYFYDGDKLYASNRVASNSLVFKPVTNPTKENYEFMGWYLNGLKFDFQTPITESISLEARYKRTNSVTITYHYNNADYDIEIDEFSINQIGSKVELPILSWNQRHKFAGWYLDAELSKEVDFENVPDYDVELYAKWEIGGRLRITFYTNGGNVIDDLYPIFPTEEISYPLPYKSGYVFDGWYLDEELTKKAPEIPLVDMDFHAKWLTRNNITIDELPLTHDNKLGVVTFNILGQRLDTDIYFEGSYYSITHRFAEDTDMTLFETLEAYYLNIDGKPQIVINHSDKLYLKDILESQDDEKPAFVHHTIWDLSTNELTTRDKYQANVLLKQNQKGLMIAYVYIDEYIIDNIVQATLSWTSRQKHGFINSIIFGDKYTEWETFAKTMTSDEEFEYRNLTNDWQDVIAFWNVISAIRKINKTYSIPRVQAVNFNDSNSEYNVQKAEVEAHFRTVNADFDRLKTNPRYKLWAFTLQEGKDWFGTQTELFNNPDDPKDDRNFKIIELIYQTNGKIYETVGSDMNINIKVDDKIDGVGNQTNDYSQYIVLGVFLISAFIVINVISKNGGFKSFNNFIKIVVILGIIGLIIFFVARSILDTNSLISFILSRARL